MFFVSKSKFKKFKKESKERYGMLLSAIRGLESTVKELKESYDSLEVLRGEECTRVNLFNGRIKELESENERLNIRYNTLHSSIKALEIEVYNDLKQDSKESQSEYIKKCIIPGYDEICTTTTSNRTEVPDSVYKWTSNKSNGDIDIKYPVSKDSLKEFMRPYIDEAVKKNKEYEIKSSEPKIIE